MEDVGLPPLVAEIADGSVTWQRLEGLDYELLGYFLSCHLIIEHYLDEDLLPIPGLECRTPHIRPKSFVAIAL
jgi:hypothetical protein